MEGTSIQIPKQLQNLKFCLVEKNTKKPFEKEWTKNPYSFNDKKLIEHLKNGGNYGVLCGFEGLIIIDADTEELTEAVLNNLPNTFRVQTGSGGVHHYYFCSELKKKIVLTKDDKHYGEVQSWGAQCVAPNSIHPNGNKYEVIQDIEIAKITKEELINFIKPFVNIEEENIEEDKKNDVGALTKEIASYIPFSKLLESYGLEKNGRNWNCPWHKSEGGMCLSVDDKKGIYNCFHCGRHGNILQFVSKIDDITIAEAIKKLKKLGGVKEEEEGNTKFKKAISFFFDKKDLARKFLKIQPLYYDKYKIWWIWNFKEYKWERCDEIDIMNGISKNSEADTITSKEKNEILESLKQISRQKMPKQIKKSWIQFKEIIIDVENGDEFKSTPEFFVTNPIPWDLNAGRISDTPIMDKIFSEWVGEKYIKTLYEILAYSLLPNYPIHRIFCFIGGGLNGKSKFLELLRQFVGKDNCCSTELDTLISSRFEITRLHKKLVCQMGETNFNELNKTSILKKLSGGDLIGFEYKNKDPFEEVNYAKILIATNNLPSTTDKTIGFYRRWDIIDFPNQFSEKKDILEEIPKEEYEKLAVKSIQILKELLKKREFSNEGSIEDRMKKYEDHSNPFNKFLEEFTEESPDGSIWKFEFQKRFNEWCKENKYRQISDVMIGKKMKQKEYYQIQKKSDWLIDGTHKMLRAWLGLKWKVDFSENNKNNKNNR